MRNERSSLIILSYIIGFTTAFILFLDNNFTNSYSAELATETIKKDNLGDKSFTLKSGDGSFIFFCDNDYSQGGFCDAFVYNVDKDSRNSLLVDGEKMKLSNDLLSILKWNSDNSLILSNDYSLSIDTNWNLITDSYSLDIR